MLKLKSTHFLLLILLVIWVLTFYLQERYLTAATILKCQWPQLSTSLSQTNILLIADPQLIDNHTYPGRNELLLKLSKHTVDTYIKKNYNELLDQLQPNYIMFLGDLLDNGRDATDEYFAQEYNRFKRIFRPLDKMFLNVPGNHDIGFGNGVKIPMRTRFEKSFGSANTVVDIDGVDFIILDTLSISSTDETINKQLKDFLYSIAKEKSKPRILLTHVPLYRDPNLSCGPLRESKTFDVNGYGYQYKNSVEESLSRDILNQIQPDITFTGDDHDYCDIQHENGYREVTVKSISMAMGKKYPAVQLLSIKNEDNFKMETEICFLQTPYINVANYVVLAIVSGILILWWNLKTKLTRYTYTSILPLHDVVNIPFEHTKKLHRFIKEQDDEHMEQKHLDISLPTSSSSNAYSLPSSIPQYTFTQSSRPQFVTKFNNTRLGKIYILNKRRLFTFIKRYSLVSFFKQSLMVGILVASIYYVGFVLTLY